MPVSENHRRGSAFGDATPDRSDAHYRLLRELLRDPFVRVAMDGRILDCNALYCELLGYSAEELGTRTYRDLTPERWHPLEDAIVREQVLPRGHSEVYEKEYRCKDGTLVPVELRTVLERDAAGDPLAMWAIVRDIGERKTTEEALREGASQYRALAESLPVVLMRYDRAHRVVYLSPQAEGITGVPVERFLGRTNREVGMPEDLCELWEAAIARVFETGEPQKLEFRFPTAEGDRTFLLTLVPERDADGSAVRHVLGVSTDITESKTTAEALDAERARLQAVLDSLPVAVWIADRQGTVLQSNRAIAQVWGAMGPPGDSPYGPERYGDYKGWWAETGEPLAAADWALARAVLHGEVSTGEVIDIERFDGARGTIVNSAAPVVDREGRIIGAVAASQDITEWRRAEAALLRSREGLRRLADASLSIMAKSDLGDLLQALAEAALALTGARFAICGYGSTGGERVLERTAHAPDAAHSPPPALSALLRRDRGGVHMALVEGLESLRLTDAGLRAHPLWGRIPAGHTPLRGLLGVPLGARDGETTGTLLVTDKAQGDFDAEDEALLKQLATVAALALSHVEARLALEESDRRKNAFLAMLGHELRNPLGPILNSLYVIERVPPGGELAREAHATIERQVGHLTRLVDDLLDITRITRGKIALRRERLDLCDLVRRAVEDYREAVSREGLELALSLPQATLWASADRTRIAQVIGNLLGNAVKFTPPGGAVSVSLAWDPDGGPAAGPGGGPAAGQAALVVRDTGIGIAPEMLPRLFEPFAQADTTLDRSRGGLGLGLAMVKGLVELHGGRATIASAGLGAGTEVSVRLPVELALPPAAAPSGARAAQGGTPRRVLVIEDNLDAAESLRLLLLLGGHIVEVARSGPEGVEKARELKPDLILCDIGLPGMDGFEVARTLRSDDTLDLRSTRLVALSGYAAPEDVARAQAAGFDAHFAKPLGLETLEAILGESRGNAGASRSLPMGRPADSQGFP